MKTEESLGQSYLEKLVELLKSLITTQLPIIKQAGAKVANAIANGNIVHVFGVGHSHILAEEVFFRAGGLAPVNAVLEPCLMLHEGALKSTQLEKLSGLAEILLNYYKIEKGDILIIASNSGVNSVPVEMAALAKERGIFTIGITSIRYSRAIKGDRIALYEIVDLAIDNLGELGDALIEVPGLPQRIGPSSTVLGAAIVNAVMIEAVAALRRMGLEPPIYVSSHLPEAMEHNLSLVRRFGGRIKSL